MANEKGSTRPLNVGMIGIGVGGAETLPAMEAMEEMNLMAGADVVETTRQRFKERYPNANVYASAEELCADPDVEAVWISSPNRFHAEHTIIAANAGKHVVVEKPMALNLEQAEQMVKACEMNGVKLLAGHTASFGAPIRAMRRIITSGKLGKLEAINMMSYSDWMLRPRSADELDIAQGGGIPYRQGPHQIDTIRVLGGGELRSVRGMTGQWMPERDIPGYYACYMEFKSGVPVTMVHNGYGYFLGNELVPWGKTSQRYTVEERVEVRKQMRAGTRDENSDKQDMRIGGAAEQAIFRSDRGPNPWMPMDPGMLVVSCERGDIRHSKFGLYVYDDEGIQEVEIGEADGGFGRRTELVELHDAVVNDGPVYHDGAWGMATLEVCLAIMESAKEHREIELTHQVPVSDHPGGQLRVSYLD